MNLTAQMDIMFLCHSNDTFEQSEHFLSSDCIFNLKII